MVLFFHNRPGGLFGKGINKKLCLRAWSPQVTLCRRAGFVSVPFCQFGWEAVFSFASTQTRHQSWRPRFARGLSSYHRSRNASPVSPVNGLLNHSRGLPSFVSKSTFAMEGAAAILGHGGERRAGIRETTAPAGTT